MAKFLTTLVILSTLSCSAVPTESTQPGDAGTDHAIDANPCGPVECGFPAKYDFQVNCGTCQAWPGTVCGDNNRPNVCGAECQPMDESIVCDYYIGKYQPWSWPGKQYAGQFDGKQYIATCKDPNVIDIHKCIPTTMDQPCKQCSTVYCCYSENALSQ